MIEAVEDSAGDPVLGVQWHAETLTARAEELALFERLVEAARARRSGERVAW
jgi:gamma-glutamyl-gamma-aminobutyrate hydrolase PuuD